MIVRSTPKNWARNSTVTPSNRAVPFWLAVAPTVRTKRAILRGSFSCSSAAFNDTGREALDEAVEKATTIGSRTPLKKAMGERPASQPDHQRIDHEHMDRHRAHGDADEGRQPHQQIPSEQGRQVEHQAGDGQRRQFDEQVDQGHGDLEDPLNHFLQSIRRRALGHDQADAEEQGEDHQGQNGVLRRRRDRIGRHQIQEEVAQLDRAVAPGLNDAGRAVLALGQQLLRHRRIDTSRPGWKTLTITRPMTTAMLDTTMVSSRVLMPARPRALRSPISATPTTRAENSSGITIMNSRRRKI